MKYIKEIFFPIAASNALFVGGMLISVGVATQISYASSHNARTKDHRLQQSSVIAHNGTPLSVQESAVEKEEKEWQELKQRLNKGGLNLTESQETRMRSTLKKFGQDMDKLVQKNDLPAMIVTMLAYDKSTRLILTPQQFAIWERVIKSDSNSSKSAE